MIAKTVFVKNISTVDQLSCLPTILENKTLNVSQLSLHL